MMYNKGKKFLAVFVVLVFAAFSMTLAFAQPTDMSGHWASDVVNKWVSQGFITGYQDGSFKPDNEISRAEFVTLVNRVFRLQDQASLTFKDVKAGDWFAGDVAKAAAAGIIKGDQNGNFNPGSPISRQEAAVVIARAFQIKASDKNAADSFKDASSIASWSKDAVSALFEKGYVKGKGANTYDPSGNLTRAEAVQMLDNVAGTVKTSAGTYTGNITGNLVINTRDVTLQNMTISGSLYLTEGIGDGNITLDGVTVKGDTVVKGGGMNSIVIKNSSLTGTLIVAKVDGKVRIVAQGATDIPSIQLNSGSKLQDQDLTGKGFGKVEIIEVPAGAAVTLDGNFEQVNVEAATVAVSVTSGTIGTLNVAKTAEGAKVQVDSQAKISTVNLDAAVAVSGSGTIETANINANGVTIEQKPQTTNVAKDVTNADVGGEKVSGQNPTTTTTTTTPPSNNNNNNESTTNYAAITGITINGTNVTGSYNSSTNVVTVSVPDNTAAASITSVDITAAGATSMDLKSVGAVSLSRTYYFSSNTAHITVQSLLSEFTSKSSISVESLKSLLGDSVTISGDLEAIPNSGYTSQNNISFTINFASNITSYNINNYVTISRETNGDFDVTVKSGQGSTLFKDIGGIDTMLSAAMGNAGLLSGQVSVHGINWYNVQTQATNIQNDIASLAGKAYSSVTLQDLQGKTIKYRATPTGSVVNINIK